MAGPDGTTFIIAYQYANEADLDDFVENVPTRDLTTPTPSLQPETPENEPNVRQQPLGKLGNDVDRDFLDGFLSGRECLPGGTSWRKYEICYSKHVIQFHMRIPSPCRREKHRCVLFVVGRRSTSAIDSLGHVESSETYRMVNEKSKENPFEERSRSTVRKRAHFPFVTVRFAFRFVSLYYTDGDPCELTKTRRVVEVKLR